MGQIEAGAPGGAARRVDGGDVVVHFAIGVEGEPVAQVGQAIGEVERSETRAGIVAAEFLSPRNVGEAEEAFQKAMQRDGDVSLAAPDDGALETEFEIFGWAEADFFDVDPRVVGLSVALERADEKVVAERAGEIGETGNVQRFDAIDAKRIDILSVVGVGEGSAQSGPKPVVLLAKGDFVIEKVRRDVGLKNAAACDGADGSHGNGGLVIGKTGCGVDERHCRRRLESVCASGRGVAGSGWRYLKLAARVEQEATGGCVAAGSGVVVESVLVGTAVVVDDGLAEVKAVVERSAGDGARSGVDGLNARLAPEDAAGALHVGVKFAIERFVDLLRLVCGWRR